MKPDEETLMAYADGELEGALKVEIEAAIAADPALAARVDAHRSLRARVGAAFGAAEAGPDPLEAMIRGDAPAEVVNLAAVRAAKTAPPPPPPRKPLPRWAPWVGIAAALVLAVMLTRPMLPGTGAPLIVSQGGRLEARGDLVRVLDTQLASEPPAAAEFRIGLTFRDKQGRYCRTFQPSVGQSLVGIACRDGRRWDVVMMTGMDGTPDAGYRTAGSGTPAPVLAAVQDMISGEPLDAAAEKAARERRWIR